MKNSLRGHFVEIQNKEGETRTGNWAGLRKQLGIVQYMNADKTEELFKTMGWEVTTHKDSPEDKIKELAKVVSSPEGIAKMQEEIADEIIDEDSKEEIKGKGRRASVVESDTELLFPQVNPDYIKRDEDEYIGSVLDNVTDEYVFGYGEAGAGKTELVKQYAAEKGLAYTRVSLDETMSLQYLIGRLWFEDGRVMFKEGLLVKALQQPGVLFLDEANAMMPSKGFVLHQLLDSGCIYIPEADKYYWKHPECRIVLAGNYQSGKYAGVQKMNHAFQNRLSMIEIPPMSVDNVKMKNVKGDEKRRFTTFFKEVERMLSDKKVKTSISMRNALRYDKFRGAGIGVKPALRMSMIDAVKYSDTDTGEEVEVLATSHFDDLY